MYDFVAPPRIVFGWGRRREVGPLAASLGGRAFLVLGSRRLAADGVVDELSASLVSAGVALVELVSISHEPEVADVDAATLRLRGFQPVAGDLVLAVGGGSAIDLAKAVAALAVNTAGESVRDYLEGVGRGLSIVAPPLPVLAMPSTAGTGSEATKNAVISCDDPPFKKSLRSDQMIPRVVLVDPELHASVPPETTAWTGMDAITQCVESYISSRARPIAQALAAEGLARALPALAEAVRDGGSRPAREAMAHAALLSGLALANSGLGLAHGVAAALGVHAHTPHGLACAVMLPAALRVNRPACERELARLARLTDTSNDADDARSADAFVARIDALVDEVGVPRRLRDLGVSREQLAALVPSSRGNSMSGNPVEVSDEALYALLRSMW